MIPIAEQIKCVKREIAMRKSAYPKWIASRRMKQDAADREIAAMEAVLKTLEDWEQFWKDRNAALGPLGRLFDECQSQLKDEEMPRRGFEPKGNQFGLRDIFGRTEEEREAVEGIKGWDL